MTAPNAYRWMPPAVTAAAFTLLVVAVLVGRVGASRADAPRFCRLRPLAVLASAVRPRTQRLRRAPGRWCAGAPEPRSVGAWVRTFLALPRLRRRVRPRVGGVASDLGWREPGPSSDRA